jgi:hypothetical protein
MSVSVVCSTRRNGKMPASDENRDRRDRLIMTARSAARRAAIDIARQHGAEIIDRPAFGGSQVTIRDVEPLAGLRAAREIELGARYHIRNYIQDAREAGYAWSEIGAALNLGAGRNDERGGQSVAEAAYSVAAGNPDSETARRYGRSFGWRCASCEGLVIDRGPFDGPVDAEPGHGDGCPRLAATVAAWEAEWEAGE